MNDSDIASARRTHAVATRTVLIAIGAFAIIAVGLYFVGLSQGRKELSAQKSAYEQRLSDGDRKLQISDAKLAEASNQIHLMKARVALYRTAVDLDQRNFGIASGRLQEAADALGLIVKDDSGIDLAKVTALKESIETSDFTVAADLESQRVLVLDFASTLDRIAADTN